MKKLTRVLQVCVRFPPAIGGVENHVLELCKNLSSQYNLSVLCSDVGKAVSDEYHYVTRLKSQFNVTNTNISLGLPLKLLKAKTDIFHTHTPTPWWSDLTVIIGKIRRIPTVITVHNDLHKNGAASIITNLYLSIVFPITLRLVDRIIMINQNWEEAFPYTAKYFRKHKEKIRIVPNGVDIATFYDNNKLTKKPNQILFVSVMDRYHDFKGLSYLLKAVQLLELKQPVKLIVVGDGETVSKYQAECEIIGIAERVNFIGSLNHRELAKVYQASEIFVLPSINTEGFGLVLLESLACGTPVITTKYAGVAQEIVANDCGILVKEKSSEQLAAAMLKLLESHELRTKMNINGKRLIEAKYTWNSVVSKIDKVYQELI